jgi:preprotein translocase subunit SecF
MTTSPFPIIQQRLRWYILSLILIIPGIISLFVWHLHVGIDFKGGTLTQLDFTDTRPPIEQLRSEVDQAGIPGVSLQTSGDKSVLVRFPNTEGREARKDADTLKEVLSKDGTALTEASFENIGGSVASSTTRSAVTAVIITSLLIIIFIAWSFGGVPKPASSWRFGVTAIVTLIHDLLFMIGAFSLIGHFFPHIEVDALFITALLTILGFSVNDTIVVFDRIRENLRRNPGKSFSEIANESLNQTLARSINTSFTVLTVLVALLLLGGESIRSFVLALTLGVAVGTYSSIFNAAPLLVTWQEFVERRAGQGRVSAKK